MKLHDIIPKNRSICQATKQYIQNNYNIHIPCHKYLKSCMEPKTYFAQASSNTTIIIVIINTIHFIFVKNVLFR